jgi:RNA polymerase sigma-B factor
MLVHIVSRPLTPSDHLHVTTITHLARSLESAGATVVEDLWALPASDIATSVSACAHELADSWLADRPDVVHTIGIVATMAAIKAAPGQDLPIVATFDERPSRIETERRLGQRVSAVMPLSLEERDRWRRDGVRTLWGGSFPFAVPVADPDACAVPGGEVVTLAAGPELDVVVSSMPFWSGPLVVASRLAPARLAAVRGRARALGVWDRIRLQPGLRGPERDQMWSHAAVLLAGREGSRHGAHVLEAAAHGVPAIAVAAGAHIDHVVPQVTGVLVPAAADARVWGRAVAAMVSDRFALRAMGTAALVRMGTLHSSELAARRLQSMYDQVVADSDDQQTVLERSGPGLRSEEERNALAVEHMPLARQLAGWYSGRGQARDDLVQVASLGLVRAAERFDPAYGKEFHSFAIPTILGELRKHFRDHAWAVRVPRGLQETTLQVQRASAQVSQSLAHEATPADLAEQLGLVEEEVLMALRAEGEARSAYSLDRPVAEDRAPADLFGEPDWSLDLVELSNAARDVLGKLPEREQQILILRFYGERTQSEIAQRLGISQVHVSRVLARTLAALRDHVLEDVPLPESWERESVEAPGIPIPSPRRAS